MRYYTIKKDISASRRQFVVNKLKDLKADLSSKICEKKTDKNLLVATWNIRDFDSNKFGHGYRLRESYYFLAQIISAFDLIAVQEVNKNLAGLNRLMYILGEDYDYICTDVTEGPSGNGERMTFIYDVRRVSFKKVAGEVVLPKNAQIKGEVQFARTPFLVSFQAGWTKFSLCTVHIYYGSDSGEKLERRKNEIEGIAKFLKKRADSDLENLIVLGDFNIVDHEHQTMEALISNGFKIPDQIKTKPVATNAFQTKHYDQIAVRSKGGYFKLGDHETSSGGYYYYDKVFTEADFDKYREFAIKALISQRESIQKQKDKELGKTVPDTIKIAKFDAGIQRFTHTLANEDKLKEYYLEEWKTFQLSDHLPLWTELHIDHSVGYLDSLLNIDESLPIE